MISQQQIERGKSNTTTLSRAESLHNPPCVLLVEDDRSLRRYFEVVLRQEGYEVFVASDGLEAMRIALRSPLDIVVTDAIMPNLNGYELCRFLRSTPHLSQLRIVLLSALEKNESQREDQNADVYLSKPISPEDLIDCIKQLLQLPQIEQTT